jgi:hypothetical protein
MFRSTSFSERVRVVVEDVLEAVDIVLSDPLDAGAGQGAGDGADRHEVRAPLGAPARPPASEHESTALRARPHRRPVRRERRRRPGAVEPVRAACACAARPVGPGPHGPLAGPLAR